MNDKDNTFIFKPDEIEVLEDKPHIDRSPRDEYSRARRTKARQEEEKPSILPYVAVGLAVVLLITVIMGVLVLRGDISFRKETEEPPVPPVVEVEEEEETEPEEEVETSQSWEITFDPDGIYHMESGNGYAVFADWYDASGKKVNSRKKVYITSETDIRDNGKRISADAFIYIIKNQGGSSVFFQSEIETESDRVLSITYDSRGFEEEPEELHEETEGEENPTETPEVPETSPEKEPVTELTPQEGEAIE